MPHDHASEDRFAELEDRLAQIEKKLGLTWRPVAPKSPELPETPPAPTMLSVPKAPPLAPPTTAAVPDDKQTALADVFPPRRVKKEPFSTEQLIGGKTFAALGAIVVVIAVGLLFKLAWDRGWFANMSPEMKIGAGVLFGFVLLGAGEWALRRINAAASAGLSAAGIGVIYTSVYVSMTLFNLFTLPTTFMLLAATAFLGIAVSVRSRLAAVAIISLIGGYLAPVLVPTNTPHPYFFTSYLVTLLLISLVLSSWIGRTIPSFRAIRSFGWWGTILLGQMWVLKEGLQTPQWALLFLSVVWAAVHAERFAASRQLFATDNPSEDTDDRPLRADLLRPSPATASDPQPMEVAASISTTAWVTALGWFIAEKTAVVEPWLIPAALGALCLTISSVFAGHLRIMRDLPRTEPERVGAGLLVQSGSLFLLAIGLGFSDWPQVIAWLSLGLAAIAGGRWINSRGLDYYGVVTLTIATAHLAVFGANATPWPAGFETLGIFVTDWQLRFFIAAAVWIAAGVLMLIRNADELPIRAVSSAGIGIIILGAFIAHPRSLAPSVLIAWMGIAGILAAAHYFIPRLHLRAMGLALCGASLVYWVAHYPLEGWSNIPAPIGLHPGLWLAFAIISVSLAVTYIRAWITDDAIRKQIFTAVAAVTTGLFFTATSFEVARGAAELASDDTVRLAALSIYWGLFGVAMIAVGFRARQPAVRYIGLALILVSTAKALVVDLAEVPAGWRIASFFGLGMLMLGVAVAYAKIAAKGEQTTEPILE